MFKIFILFALRGLLNILIKFKNIIILLLNIEFIIFSLFILLLIYLSQKGTIILSIYYLIFSVCEGVIGLSLLIYIRRCYGRDYVFGFSFI